MQRRNSLRYPEYDYSTPGGYFVTICIHLNLHLFGSVEQGNVHLTPAGEMAHEVLDNLPAFVPSLAVETFIVMPNHVHALVFLGVDPDVYSPSLGAVVSRFKSVTTTRYIAGVKDRGWPRFDARLWQRDYYEHIVRSDRGVERIREYIQGNPARWQDRIDSSRYTSLR
jgi:putative transposase